MYGWLFGGMGLVLTRCPHCGHVQMRARNRANVLCKSCRKGFSEKEGREALARAAARHARRR